MLLKLYITILILSHFFLIICEYSYNPSDVIEYINNEISYTREDYISFLDELSNTFLDIYTFNDICKNPPQPNFNSNYFTKVDIQNELNSIDLDDITPYEFYREIMLVLSKLKDQHIHINWAPLNLDKFYMLNPFDYSMKEDSEGNPKIFGECVDEEDLIDFDNGYDIYDKCEDIINSPIKYINDMDPFDYIQNFGGNFLSLKNSHSTFSFKLNYHNNVPLKDYPLSLDELENYKIEFESGDIFETQFLIISEIDIQYDFRNLNDENNNSKKYNNNQIFWKNRKKRNFQKLNKLNSEFFYWNYEYDDILKCHIDNENKLNTYYINSFEAKNIDIFIETLENCYKLFDNNDFPIMIINDFNNGGYISLSQLFLGIISPTIPIKLYTGRMRISDIFQNAEDINNFISSNFTKIEDCSKNSFLDLMRNKNEITYDNIQSELTDSFHINNITIYNLIEKARKEMKNKRNPNEIIIFTDGYSFSAASLYIKYLKQSGGGIIVRYLGNPYSEDVFDISQSPSPVFTSNIIKIFSKENYKELLEEYECELQLPGIQTFYDDNNESIPLEYSISFPDENSEIYEIFDENNYQKFVDKATIILNKYKDECNNEANLLKISEECDSNFVNSYTHGGYICKEDNLWSNECIASFCDLGYTFSNKYKKCMKDKCSLFDIKEDMTDQSDFFSDAMSDTSDILLKSDISSDSDEITFEQYTYDISNISDIISDYSSDNSDIVNNDKKNKKKKKQNLFLIIGLPIIVTVLVFSFIFILAFKQNTKFLKKRRNLR